MEAKPCSSLRRWVYAGTQLGFGLAALVPLVVYFGSGRWFVRGIAAGAGKG